MMVMVGLPAAPVMRAPHGVLEEIGEVNDFRFAGGAFNLRHAFGERGGHHDIGGAKDGGTGAAAQKYIRAGQLLGAGVDITVFHADFCAERFKALEMKIDGPRADDATARQGNGGVAQTAKQRAHDANGAAHFADEIVIADVLDFAGLHLERAVLEAGTRAKRRQDFAHEFHVAQVRDAMDDARLGREQRRGHDGQHGVFRTADGHFAM